MQSQVIKALLEEPITDRARVILECALVRALEAERICSRLRRSASVSPGGLMGRPNAKDVS